VPGLPGQRYAHREAQTFRWPAAGDLAIARACDEPGESLSTSTSPRITRERAVIQENMKHVVRGRTGFIIAPPCGCPATAIESAIQDGRIVEALTASCSPKSYTTVVAAPHSRGRGMSRKMITLPAAATRVGALAGTVLRHVAPHRRSERSPRESDFLLAHLEIPHTPPPPMTIFICDLRRFATTLHLRCWRKSITTPGCVRPRVRRQVEAGSALRSRESQSHSRGEWIGREGGRRPRRA